MGRGVNLKDMRMKLLFAMAVAWWMVACSAADDFVVERGKPARLLLMTAEEPVVQTAVELLQGDYEALFGERMTLATATEGEEAPIIVVATCGCGAADSLLQQLGIERDSLMRHAESYYLGVRRTEGAARLYIIGGDAHGTAYGIMELSRRMGISPWAWWADSPVVGKRRWRLASCEKIDYPAVRYRGIFLNDEDFALIPWAHETHDPDSQPGELGPKSYSRIFELLLRLGANTCWPAMHESTIPFFFVEGNREAAEKYGIYMGASHCEPMARNTNGEWRVSGEGEYDYVHNSEAVRRFWRERVEEVAQSPVIYTLGMRGVHDGSMNGAKTIDEQRAVLTRVLADQRAMLAELVDSTLQRIPQVFIPYKEVLDIYHAGLEVPDDVTLMWCDDNYGYIRHQPDAEERLRSGGHGLYYHISYWGRPHDYLWLPSTHPALMTTELLRAYEAGNRRMWVVNVGDIKPAEYLTELFLDIAWNPDRVREAGVRGHLERFMEREFGPRVATRTADLMLDYYHLAHLRRPEFMAHTRTEERDPAYKRPTSLPWHADFVRARIAAYDALTESCDRLTRRIDPLRSDSWYQLVEYPVQAAAAMSHKWCYAQLARQGVEGGSWQQADEAFRRIVQLTRRYNEELSDGKWNKMMNYHPRNLAVYDSVPRERFEGVLEEEIYSRCKPLKWERTAPIAELGYSRQAMPLEVGKPLEVTLGAADSVVLAFLPNHPVASDSLRLRLSIDGGEAVVTNIATYGRSETWKRNIQRNLALCPLPFGPLAEGKHTLRIEALDPYVLLDEIYVE